MQVASISKQMYQLRSFSNLSRITRHEHYIPYKGASAQQLFRAMVSSQLQHCPSALASEASGTLAGACLEPSDEIWDQSAFSDACIATSICMCACKHPDASCCTGHEKPVGHEQAYAIQQARYRHIGRPQCKNQYTTLVRRVEVASRYAACQQLAQGL
jgi:hypothetical protein